eukprot:TRINITY_DN11154_c0_g3_i15.p1 TRINITY_DN11154_c0_g3~~TRINITY_DN11154_c0_g3_i15.p1  ORF type:complete len:100 (-),score=15.71 TRINITY_DN11154_c0_g3_i15:466-765(-)
MIKVMDTDKGDRKQQLLDMLDVDLEWRMHKISDGEMRRVQILMALLRPFSILLLDEITVDLDVLTRIKLLQFSKKNPREVVQYSMQHTYLTAWTVAQHI